MTITCLNCGHALWSILRVLRPAGGLHPVTIRALLQQVSKVLFDVDRGTDQGGAARDRSSGAVLLLLLSLVVIVIAVYASRNGLLRN